MKFVPAPPQKLFIRHLLTHDTAYGNVGMGIGKTAAVLCAISALLEEQESIGALVVAPLWVTNLTWMMEPKEWDDFKHLRIANLRTELGRRSYMVGNADLYLCNYEFLPKLVEMTKKRGGTVPYDTVLWDEATRAKNHKSVRINEYRKGMPRVKRNWAMSGTPAPNGLMDLFAQIRLIDEGIRLGRSFDHFKRTFFHPTDYMQYNWEANAGAKETIEQKISDITLTLLSEDWLDIPQPVFEDVEVKLPDDVMRDYRKLEKDMLLELKNGKTITAGAAAAILTKLMQFTGGAVYDEERKWHVVHEEKIAAIRKIRKSVKTPILVLQMYQHEIERLREAFPDAEFFADEKGMTAKQDMLRRWNAKKIPMLVCHPASAGHGLNLQHGGNTLIYYSLTYSHEFYEQAIKRLVRRGQTETVTVYRLMCPGTVDETVAAALADKKGEENRLFSALKRLEAAREAGILENT
jgi:SNF2 family DNA or RNA helicase